MNSPFEKPLTVIEADKLLAELRIDSPDFDEILEKLSDVYYDNHDNMGSQPPEPEVVSIVYCNLVELAIAARNWEVQYDILQVLYAWCWDSSTYNNEDVLIKNMDNLLAISCLDFVLQILQASGNNKNHEHIYKKYLHHESPIIVSRAKESIERLNKM